MLFIFKRVGCRSIAGRTRNSNQVDQSYLAIHTGLGTLVTDFRKVQSTIHTLLCVFSIRSCLGSYEVRNESVVGGRNALGTDPELCNQDVRFTMCRRGWYL